MKATVLFVGVKIIHDKALIDNLKNCVNLILLENTNQLENLFQKKTIDLIVFEISDEIKKSLNLLKIVKKISNRNGY